MRIKIWNIVTSKLDQGSLLPWWALLIHNILFPIKAAFWRYSQKEGYDPYTDTWTINGVRVSSTFFNNELDDTYHIKRVGNKITLTWIKDCSCKNSVY